MKALSVLLRSLLFVWGGAALLVPCHPASAQTSAPATNAITRPDVTDCDRHMRARAAKLTARGAQYLLSAQEKDGGWASQQTPGITGLVLKALIQEPTVGPRHPAVRRGIEFILSYQREDGGIYHPEGLLKNYESSVALSMFAALKDPAYDRQIKALQKFLKDNQWDEGEDKSPDDPFYGGAGYGRHKRPDLSNTQMMLEALRDSGLPPDDPAYQKALVFISRCQMLSESNDQAFAKGSSQGGFIYTAAAGGVSALGGATTTSGG